METTRVTVRVVTEVRTRVCESIELRTDKQCDDMRTSKQRKDKTIETILGREDVRFYDRLWGYSCCERRINESVVPSQETETRFGKKCKWLIVMLLLLFFGGSFFLIMLTHFFISRP